MKRKHLTTEDLADFFAELHILRQAEIPEKEALLMMLEGQDKKTVHTFLTSLTNTPNLLSGLEQFSESIPEYLIVLLRYARKENAEIKVLADIAEHLNDLTITDTGGSYRQKLKSRLLYPAIILLVVTIMATVIMLYVMPVFAEMFKSFGAALPALTQLFVTLSETLQQYFAVPLILLVVVAVYFNSPYSAAFKSRQLLQLPAIGQVMRGIESTAILRTLHLLSGYQIGFAEALRLSASASQNRVTITELTECADNFAKSGELIPSLQTVSVFSAKTRRLLAVFEKTQQVQILKNLADYHDKQIPRQTTLSLQVLEVVLLVACAMIVGAMVIAIYLPIFAMGSAVG